jgi:hypothetical protein
MPPCDILSICRQFVPAQITPTRLGYRASGKILSSTMEGTMSGRAADVSRYPSVEFVLHAVAGWIDKFRMMNGMRDELGKCSPEEARQIAKDLGIPVEELRRLVTKAPLQRMPCRKCCRHFPWTHERWRTPIPRLCGTCSERASFAITKACVNASSPRALPLSIFVSSALTLIHSTRCSKPEADRVCSACRSRFANVEIAV